MAQTVKNLPAMRETWVQHLGQEDALEKGMATHVLKSALNERFCPLCNSGVERGNRQCGRLKHGINSYSDPFQAPSGGRERRNSPMRKEIGRLRPYHPEHARSHLISEAKQGWAWLVLGWEKGSRWVSLPKAACFWELALSSGRG